MAEATYYFNSRSTGNWADPDYMIDNVLTNHATTAKTGTTETLDGNTCPSDDLGTITKTEIHCYGWGDGDDKITLNGTALTMPSSADWSSYVDVGITTWAGVVALDATVVFTKSGKGNTMHCAKVEIRVTYTEVWEPPESDIDVGAEPIDRASLRSALATSVDKNNPANASGTLHSIKIHAAINMTGLRVGTFYTTNGNTLKCRDSVLIGAVEAGAERTFTELSITVVAGDYIGAYWATGDIELDTSGFSGFWTVAGEHIDPNDEAEYTFYAGDAISLYGYGDIGEGPTPNAFNKIFYTEEPPTPSAWNQVKRDTGVGYRKLEYS